MRVIEAETSIPTAMSDKNPKAKRKLQTQQEMQRKQKIEEQQRGQQQLHESQILKHPREAKE